MMVVRSSRKKRSKFQNNYFPCLLNHYTAAVVRGILYPHIDIHTDLP